MDNKVNKSVEKFTLEDGRMAERHITINDSGERVVEVYVQDRLPLKLERRVTEKKKEVVHEQKIEQFKDGEVVNVKVLSSEPNVKMELREHLGSIEKHELNSLNYVTKKDLLDVVTQAVVAGVNSAKQQYQPVQQVVAPKSQPLFKAQSIVEERVEEKSKNDNLWVAVMSVILIGQIAFFGYLLLG